jgi:hypothetical protein
MAAMSVVSYNPSRHTYTASSVVNCNSLSPGYSIFALDLSYFNSLEATVLFRHIFKTARRSSVTLLPSSESCTVPDIWHSLRSAPCWASNFSLPSAVNIETRRWENKKKQHWRTKRFMYIIMKAHGLLNSEMRSKLFLSSSCLHLCTLF